MIQLGTKKKENELYRNNLWQLFQRSMQSKRLISRLPVFKRRMDFLDDEYILYSMPAFMTESERNMDIYTRKHC